MYYVKIKAIIWDSAARSFVTCIREKPERGHGGLFRVVGKSYITLAGARRALAVLQLVAFGASSEGDSET